jgi:dTDP-glucose 4,6-dehydratase/UDP-glucuronate decarboxylase
MKAATEVIATDLDLLSHQLRAEFDALSGRSVLIAGGAGFLGYYLVQGALHWNRTHAAQPPIQVTVLDNFIRGVPAWLMALEQGPNLRLLKHDITQPLPAALGDVEYLIHAASIASRLTTASFPSKRWTPTSTVCVPARPQPAQKQRASRVEGVLLFQQRNIR